MFYEIITLTIRKSNMTSEKNISKIYLNHFIQLTRRKKNLSKCPEKKRDQQTNKT